jgi:tetratricopeptide (TPR) repeat protein
MKLILLSTLFCFSLNALAQITAGEAKALEGDAMRLWEKRDDKSSLEEALSKFELMKEGRPMDRDLLIHLSRGYFLLGELSMNKDEKMRAYEKSKDYGLAGLSLNNDFKKRYEDNFERASENLKVEDVPSAFWTAAAFGRWSKLNGVMSSLKYKDKMLALITMVEKLQPDYFHGAVYRFWGGFYAVAPGIVGGDMKKSKQYFEKVFKTNPEYVGNKVGYAELYLTEKDDEKGFKNTLQEVLAAPVPADKDILPENLLERKKAEYMLEHVKDFF